MKLFSILIFGLILSSSLHSQINRIGIFDDSYEEINIDGDLFFYQYDRKNQTINVFTIKGNLFRSLKLFIPKNDEFESLFLIGSSLFTTSDSLEIAYFTTTYASPSNLKDFEFDIVSNYLSFYVINEDGDVLFKKRNCFDVSFDQSNGKKIIKIKSNNGNSFHDKINTEIYTLNEHENR